MGLGRNGCFYERRHGQRGGWVLFSTESSLLQEASYRDVNRILLGLSVSNLGGYTEKKRREKVKCSFWVLRVHVAVW